jgi:hypothetical protein
VRTAFVATASLATDFVRAVLATVDRLLATPHLLARSGCVIICLSVCLSVSVLWFVSLILSYLR